MTIRARFALAMLASISLLGIGVASAPATRLEFKLFERGFRIVWSATKPLNLVAAGTTVSCPVTLEGTFHSHTVSKVSGALIGYITRAAMQSERCTGGHARLLTESLAWHVKYTGFTGALPSFTGINWALINASFGIEPGLGINCLARAGSTASMALKTGEGGEPALNTTIEVTPDSSTTIPLTGSGCPATGRLEGSSTRPTHLGEAEQLAIKLVA
jgi:hypothetical protein